MSAHSAPAEIQIRELLGAYFCRMADTVGLPRSVAIIYHLLFLSPHPLSFGDIVDQSGISKASASTGLRFLERMRGVEIIVVTNDRRTFYQAELSIRRLINGFVRENLQPGMDAGQQLLDNAAANASEPKLSPLLLERLASLRSWHSLARELLPSLASLEQSQG